MDLYYEKQISTSRPNSIYPTLVQKGGRTKQPILKWDKIADFVKEQTVIRMVSLIEASWPNYR